MTDHHAVIPTAEIAGADLVSLPTGERNVLTMLAARLLCAVGEPHIYAETAVTLECGGGSFTAKGRTEAAMGWKEAERACLASLKKAPKGEPPAALPELAEGQTLEGGDAVLKSGTTSPPARFSEDTLLLAMERASAEDFAKLEDVERKGLGTPPPAPPSSKSWCVPATRRGRAGIWSPRKRDWPWPGLCPTSSNPPN